MERRDELRRKYQEEEARRIATEMKVAEDVTRKTSKESILPATVGSEKPAKDGAPAKPKPDLRAGPRKTGLFEETRKSRKQLECRPSGVSFFHKFFWKADSFWRIVLNALAQHQDIPHAPHNTNRMFAKLQKSDYHLTYRNISASVCSARCFASTRTRMVVMSPGLPSRKHHGAARNGL